VPFQARDALAPALIDQLSSGTFEIRHLSIHDISSAV
jgi:hypothetical protein